MNGARLVTRGGLLTIQVLAVGLCEAHQQRVRARHRRHRILRHARRIPERTLRAPRDNTPMNDECEDACHDGAACSRANDDPDIGSGIFFSAV